MFPVSFIYASVCNEQMDQIYVGYDRKLELLMASWAYIPRPLRVSCSSTFLINLHPQMLTTNILFPC
jgi:hypothetical protein